MKGRCRTLTACSLLVSVPLLVSCTKNVSRVETARLDKANPTAYVFDVPPAVVHDRILEVLRVYHAPDLVFGERELAGDDTRYADSFAVEDARDPTFGKRLLTKRGNERDVYVHTFGDPLWASPVYRGSRGVLPFVVAFHVHLAPQGNDRTLVSIRAIDPQLRNGRAWQIGSCGPVYAHRYQRVKPTTVEEYALLRYIGQNLGATEMPEVVLPD